MRSSPARRGTRSLPDTFYSGVSPNKTCALAHQPAPAVRGKEGRPGRLKTSYEAAPHPLGRRRGGENPRPTQVLLVLLHQRHAVLSPHGPHPFPRLPSLGRPRPMHALAADLIACSVATRVTAKSPDSTRVGRGVSRSLLLPRLLLLSHRVLLFGGLFALCLLAL